MNKGAGNILEPQIISFYNELPQYAVIIDNLNQEYEILEDKYKKIYREHHATQAVNHLDIDPQIREVKHRMDMVFCGVVIVFLMMLEYFTILTMS